MKKKKGTCSQLLDLGVVELEQLVDPGDKFSSALRHDDVGGWLVVGVGDEKKQLLAHFCPW